MNKMYMIALCLMASATLLGSQMRRRSLDYIQTASARRYDYRYTDSARNREHFMHEEKRQNEERNKLVQAIAKKFSMKEDETFTSESFQDLAGYATPQQPFFLAVVAAPRGNYHFFSAPDLATYMNTGKVQNPINRQPIQQIVIFRYNGEEKSHFPFDYVETINNPQMDYFKRIYGARRSNL